MEVIFILLAISVLLATGFLAAFFWADKNGQNDDLYSPGVRMLWDDKPENGNSTEAGQNIKS